MEASIFKSMTLLAFIAGALMLLGALVIVTVLPTSISPSRNAIARIATLSGLAFWLLFAAAVAWMVLSTSPFSWR